MPERKPPKLIVRFECDHRNTVRVTLTAEANHKNQPKCTICGEKMKPMEIMKEIKDA